MLTFTQHQKLGKELKTVHEILTKAYTLIANSYPKTQIEATTAKKAYEAIMNLTNIMDDTVCKENPDKSDAIRCYYGQ